MKKLVVESPAKINLGLNVVRKRPDGFHELETIFLPLLLSDILTFTPSKKLNIQSNSKILNQISDNLVFKAIELLEKRTDKEIQINVFIEKNIPIGGGLGGGSSNAALTLKTINKIFEIGLNLEDLSKLALELGSDVPYFLNPVASFAESRGELLYPLNLDFAYPILIVNPGLKIDTSWAFSKIKPSIPIRSLGEMAKNKLPDLIEFKGLIRNDFEEIVFEEFPEIKEIKENLYSQGAQYASMSGTGSTVFGIFSNLQKAYWAEELFKQKYFTYLNNPFFKGSIT